VRICVFVQDPDAGKKGSRSDSTNRETIISAGKTLASFGVHVTLRPRIHEKLIVIDESIFWDGSLNVLSHNDSTERMTRWNCREKVVEAINRHKLYACLTCLSRTQFQLLPNKENNCDFKIIGRFLKKRREFLGLSQGELAMKSGLSQNLISCIENASRDVKVSTLSRVCGELGVRLRGLPWFMMPGLDEHFLDD
jgi:DNA-binding Xre family transcriptional regulator